ncbi:MAG TPA: hypothetical protein PLE10_06260 [Brevefilum sp.]|nr:hypothetical protein [Brevefilum sp.]HOR19414.1 hypothetical protein [Brevefilum sp.]HPL69947.1 hypothetical protein [Brevefilum sp.]
MGKLNSEEIHFTNKGYHEQGKNNVSISGSYRVGQFGIQVGRPVVLLILQPLFRVFKSGT